MAHYIRYEIYLPVRYKDEAGNLHSIEAKDYWNFFEEVRRKYGGYTQSNPTGFPLYRGYWESGEAIEVDELIYFMVLVRYSDLDSSLEDFTQWKSALEERYRQKLILVTYYPVQIIGEL
jgi:hypothetical protein